MEGTVVPVVNHDHVHVLLLYRPPALAYMPFDETLALVVLAFLDSRIHSLGRDHMRHNRFLEALGDQAVSRGDVEVRLGSHRKTVFQCSSDDVRKQRNY